jgi:two-component system, cell cycle response regulator DivK
MKTVLVVEDNEDNLELIVVILQSAGYQTMTAMTGLLGLEMALTKKPDFILLDIQLPDISGEEVLTKLRATDDGKNIPLIALTSYAMAGDRERLMAAGCDGYIDKPIDPTMIISQIEKILDDLA